MKKRYFAFPLVLAISSHAIMGCDPNTDPNAKPNSTTNSTQPSGSQTPASDPGAANATKEPLAIVNVGEGTAALAVRLEKAVMGLRMFTIVSMSSRESVLKEQAFDQTGLSDGNDALEIGKLVSAKKMIEVQIKENLYVARLVLVEKGTSEKQWNESFEANDASKKAAQGKLIAQVIADLSGKTIEQVTALAENTDGSDTQNDAVKQYNGFLNTDGSYTIVDPKVMYGGVFEKLASGRYTSTNSEGMCKVFGLGQYSFSEGSDNSSDNVIQLDYSGKFIGTSSDRTVTKLTCRTNTSKPNYSLVRGKKYRNSDGSYTIVDPRVMYGGEFQNLASGRYTSTNSEGMCKVFGLGQYSFSEGSDNSSDNVIQLDYSGKFIGTSSDRIVTKLTCRAP